MSPEKTTRRFAPEVKAVSLEEALFLLSTGINPQDQYACANCGYLATIGCTHSCPTGAKTASLTYWAPVGEIAGAGGKV